MRRSNPGIASLPTVVRNDGNIYENNYQKNRR